VNFRHFFFLFFQFIVYASFAHSVGDTLTSAGEESIDTSYDSPPFISYEYATDIERRYFDSNFKDRYRTENFQYEPQVKHYGQWAQFRQWIIHWLERLFNIQDKNAASNWFEYLKNFIALLLVISVVYFIAKSILNKEGGWIFGRDNTSDTIDHKNIEEKLQLADFGDLVDKAKKKADYRLAIRFYYLWLLRRLSDKQYIEWDVNKTNTDYFYEIKDKKLRDQYSYHRYIYDYIWYGEFVVSEQEFDKVELSFNEIFRSIDG